MSSPPPLDIPTSDLDDIDMADDSPGAGQSVPGAPPANPLFLPSTPSAAGTPARSQNMPYETPLRGVTARRALGMATPKKTPLFARKKTRSINLD